MWDTYTNIERQRIETLTDHKGITQRLTGEEHEVERDIHVYIYMYPLHRTQPSDKKHLVHSSKCRYPFQCTHIHFKQMHMRSSRR